MVLAMDLARLNEDACNHEETRAALKAANVNFALLKAALDQLIAELEEIKRTCARPT